MEAGHIERAEKAQSICVARWIRVSTQEQADRSRHAGVQRQYALTDAIIESRGYKLIASFEVTDVSGASVGSTPEFKKLLGLIESGQIKAVIVESVSRLQRTALVGTLRNEAYIGYGVYNKKRDPSDVRVGVDGRQRSRRKIDRPPGEIIRCGECAAGKPSGARLKTSPPARRRRSGWVERWVCQDQRLVRLKNASTYRAVNTRIWPRRVDFRRPRCSNCRSGNSRGNIWPHLVAISALCQ